MKAQIESLLSLLFPPRLGRIDGVIVEAEPHPLAPQHPPLREGEDGCGHAVEHEERIHYRNGIERHWVEAEIGL